MAALSGSALAQVDYPTEKGIQFKGYQSLTFGFPLRHADLSSKPRESLAFPRSMVFCHYTRALVSWDGGNSLIGPAVSTKEGCLLPTCVPDGSPLPETNLIPGGNSWSVYVNIVPGNYSCLLISATHGGSRNAVQGIFDCNITDAWSVVQATHSIVLYLSRWCCGSTECKGRDKAHFFNWHLYSTMNWFGMEILESSPLRVLTKNGIKPSPDGKYRDTIGYGSAPGALVAITYKGKPTYLHIATSHGKGIAIKVLDPLDVEFVDSGEPVVFLERDTTTTTGNLAVTNRGCHVVAAPAVPSGGNFKLPSSSVRYIKSDNSSLQSDLTFNCLFGELSASLVTQLAAIPAISGTYRYVADCTNSQSIGAVIESLRTTKHCTGNISPDLWYAYTCFHPALRGVLYASGDECQIKGERLHGDILRYNHPAACEKLTGRALILTIYADILRRMSIADCFRFVPVDDITSPLGLVFKYCKPAVCKAVFYHYTMYMLETSSANAGDGGIAVENGQIGRIDSQSFHTLDPDCLGLGQRAALQLRVSPFELKCLWYECVRSITSKGFGGTVFVANRGGIYEELIFVGDVMRGSRLLQDPAPICPLVLQSGQCVQLFNEYYCLKNGCGIVRPDRSNYALVEYPEIQIPEVSKVPVWIDHDIEFRASLEQVLSEYGYELAEDGYHHVKDLPVDDRPQCLYIGSGDVADNFYITVDELKKYLAEYRVITSFWAVTIGVMEARI